MAFFISAEPASLVAGSAEGISSLVLMLDGCIGDVHMCGGVLCVVSLIVPGLIAIIAAFLFATWPSILTGPQDSFW